MLKIRLKRYGRKKRAVYRIIVIDSRRRRDGIALEEVGFYNPLTKESKINIPRIKTRINSGAQISKIVEKLIKEASIN